MFNEINKKTSETEFEDLPFVRVADLYEAEAVFCFMSINLKKAVKTDYGVQDIAYCKIHILKCEDGIPALDAENKETSVDLEDECMVSIKQSGLLKLIKYAVENGQDLTGQACQIRKASSKKGNSYYYFEDA
jgi:hypothetical protein